MIELKWITSKQGDFLLNIPKLNLQKGDFTAVLGNNGSGKSTFLLLLAGFKKIHGLYRLYHSDFQTIPIRKRSRLFHLLPQSITLNMPFDVFYVVLTGRFSHSMAGRYSNIDLESTERIMVDFDIIHLKDRPFSELSGGEKQRVLLARAINSDATVLLLDEPLRGIDIRHQYESIHYLKKLRGDKIILVVIHDISFALGEFDRFLCFVKGKLTYDVKEDRIREEKLSEVFGVDLNILKHEKRLFVYL